MSNLLGNIFLLLAAFVFSLLFTSFFHSKISTSNDQGASGYVMILAFFIHLVFLGLVFAASVSISHQGGFDWISQRPFTRNLFLAIGLLSMVVVSAICLASEQTGSNVPAFLERVMGSAPFIILNVILASGFILNNSVLRDNVPVPVYKWPLIIISGLCFIAIVAFSISAMLSKPLTMAESTKSYENAPSVINDRLKQIDQADVMSEQAWILELTSALHPQQVRETAAAKFKTHPDWQNELVRLLESDNALYAFSFLASNDVEDPSLFPEAVKVGASNTAVFIRHDIQAHRPSDFEPTMYALEVESVLNTLSKFEDKGVDFLPAVKEIRSALDEPVAGKVFNFNCSKLLDSWIEKHS